MWQGRGMLFFSWVPRFQRIILLSPLMTLGSWLHYILNTVFCSVRSTWLVIGPEGKRYDHLWKTPKSQDRFFHWITKVFLSQAKDIKNLWGSVGYSPERREQSSLVRLSAQTQHPHTTSCSHYCSLQLMLTAKVQGLLCFPCSWC